MKTRIVFVIAPLALLFALPTHASTPIVTFSGDLNGNMTTQTVTGLQGFGVSNSIPSSTNVLAYSSGLWRPTALSTANITPGSAGQIFVSNATPNSAWTSLISYETTHGRFMSGGGGSDYKVTIGPLVGSETSYGAVYALAAATAPSGSNWAFRGDGTSVTQFNAPSGGEVDFLVGGSIYGAFTGSVSTGKLTLGNVAPSSTNYFASSDGSSVANINIPAAGIINVQGGASSYFTFTPATAALIQFNATNATSGTIGWTGAAAAAGNTTTISGQSAGGAANNGGNLNLNAGAATGTGVPGAVQLQSGGTTMAGFGQYGMAMAVQTVAIAAGTTTLSAAQYQAPYIVLTGAIGGGAANVVFPNNPGFWQVDCSQVTGASTIVFKSGTATAAAVTTPVGGTQQIVQVSTLRGANTIAINL